MRPATSQRERSPQKYNKVERPKTSFDDRTPKKQKYAAISDDEDTDFYSEKEPE